MLTLPEGLSQTKEELIAKLQNGALKEEDDSERMFTSFPSYCDDDEKTFNPIRFAESVLANFKIKTTRDNETVYIYDKKKGIYCPVGEAAIKGLMAKILGKETRHRHYADVIFYIKGMTYFDRPLTIDPQKVVVANGVLDVETRQVSPFTSDTFYLIAIPVTYDEKAECPKTLKFLAQVVGERLLPLMQEMFGYCILQDYPFHIAFMFVGEGKNGKSTLQKLLAALLGKENVSHETLQDLCYNRFSKSQLYGRLANLCADIPITPLTHTGNFKMLTGNDPISAEHKFKNPFSLTNYAKLVFSCNQVPETKDDTDAFYRRWTIIPCNNVFSGDKCDPHILDKLTTQQELSGLLNWALTGLKRLLETNTFTGNEDFEEQRKQYIRKSNSSKAFIEECLTYDPDCSAIIPEAELYQRYITFCKDNELPSSKKAVLTQNINQYLAQAKQTVERIDGKLTHVWQYVKIVTTVTTVTTSSTKETISKYFVLKEPPVTVVTPVTNSKQEYQKLVEAPVTPATNSSKVSVMESPSSEAATQVSTEGETRVCGHCLQWHKQSCTITKCDPEARYDCVSPLNVYAQSCQDYVDTEALVKGAASILNGTSGRSGS